MCVNYKHSVDTVGVKVHINLASRVVLELFVDYIIIVAPNTDIIIIVVR